MELNLFFDKEKKIINKLLYSYFDDKMRITNNNELMRLCYEMVKEFITRDGKRIRALLCIAAYKAFNPKAHSSIYQVALSLELMHASTLIHDDVMDEDNFRRGKPSMHSMLQKWYLDNFEEKYHNGGIFISDSAKTSASMAIILGNILYSISQSMTINSGFPDKKIRQLISMHNETYNTINQGQNLDLVLSHKKQVTEEEYLNMIYKKTACLFSSSISAGLICTDSNESVLSHLNNYSTNVALAFQIMDDLIDLSDDCSKGHELGSDILEGKKTLIIIHALANCTQKDKKRLMDSLGNKNLTKKRIYQMISILKKTGSLEYAEDKAKSYIIDSKKYLQYLKNKISKESFDFFNQLADFIIKRKK